jgi:hypothetical protein
MVVGLSTERRLRASHRLFGLGALSDGADWVTAGLPFTPAEVGFGWAVGALLRLVSTAVRAALGFACLLGGLGWFAGGPVLVGAAAVRVSAGPVLVEAGVGAPFDGPGLGGEAG